MKDTEGSRLAPAFARIRSGWIIAVFLGGLSAGGLFVPATYPALQEVIIDLSVLLGLYLLCRVYDVKVKQLIGYASRPMSLLRPALWVVPPLLMLSVGLLLLIPWALSYIAPPLTSWLLDILNSGEALPLVPSVVSVILTVTLVPIYEEFLFRGLLLHRWSEKYSVVKGVIFSSLAFGVLHTDLIGAFVFGYVMCVLYIQTKTLVVPIIAHALNNMIAGVPELFDVMSGVEVDTTLTLSDLRSGWLFGALCLALSVPWLIVYIRKNRISNLLVLPYAANSPQIKPR